MEKYGGNFVKALAECFRMADDNNFEKLQTAFPGYWEQYKKMSGFKSCEENVKENKLNVLNVTEKGQ